MYCKNCGNQLESASKFCSLCGCEVNTIYNEDIEEISEFAMSQSDTSVFCVKCGMSFLNEMDYCPTCGEKNLAKLHYKEENIKNIAIGIVVAIGGIISTLYCFYTMHIDTIGHNLGLAGVKRYDYRAPLENHEIVMIFALCMSIIAVFVGISVILFKRHSQ